MLDCCSCKCMSATQHRAINVQQSAQRQNEAKLSCVGCCVCVCVCTLRANALAVRYSVQLSAFLFSCVTQLFPARSWEWLMSATIKPFTAKCRRIPLALQKKKMRLSIVESRQQAETAGCASRVHRIGLFWLFLNRGMITIIRDNLIRCHVGSINLRSSVSINIRDAFHSTVQHSTSMHVRTYRRMNHRAHKCRSEIANRFPSHLKIQSELDRNSEPLHSATRNRNR